MVSNAGRVVICAALFVAGCSTFRVSADYDRDASFGDLRTYAWRDTPAHGVDPRLDVTPLGQRVRASADRELAAKGYRLAAPGQRADFIVGHHFVLEHKETQQAIGGWYGYRGGPRMSRTIPYDYDEGTLLIDVIQPDSRSLLWRGSATAVIDRSASPQKRERRIDEAVTKILAQFPPR